MEVSVSIFPAFNILRRRVSSSLSSDAPAQLLLSRLPGADFFLFLMVALAVIYRHSCKQKEQHRAFLVYYFSQFHEEEQNLQKSITQTKFQNSVT